MTVLANSTSYIFGTYDIAVQNLYESDNVTYTYYNAQGSEGCMSSNDSTASSEIQYLFDQAIETINQYDVVSIFSLRISKAKLKFNIKIVYFSLRLFKSKSVNQSPSYYYINDTDDDAVLNFEVDNGVYTFWYFQNQSDTTISSSKFSFDFDTPADLSIYDV